MNSHFRKVVPTATKCKLCKAFIIPYLDIVEHFCGARNRDKLQNLNKRALRIILDEKSLHYQQLQNKRNSSDLNTIRFQDMMIIIVFRQIYFHMMPKYLRGLFQMRNTILLKICEDPTNMLFHT